MTKECIMKTGVRWVADFKPGAIGPQQEHVEKCKKSDHVNKQAVSATVR